MVFPKRMHHRLEESACQWLSGDQPGLSDSKKDAAENTRLESHLCERVHLCYMDESCLWVVLPAQFPILVDEGAEGAGRESRETLSI